MWTWGCAPLHIRSQAEETTLKTHPRKHCVLEGSQSLLVHTTPQGVQCCNHVPLRFPEPPHQLHEHTCGGWALLTHRYMSQQAWAPPVGADISVLGCRWGPQSHPLPRKPQAVPAGRDWGPWPGAGGEGWGAGRGQGGHRSQYLSNKSRGANWLLSHRSLLPVFGSNPSGQGEADIIIIGSPSSCLPSPDVSADPGQPG